MLHDFANLKSYEWNTIKVPLLFFYLVLVAQSGEITVKCRSISGSFQNNDVVSLFVFFEIEVFAFFGIIFGLWMWLTGKFFLNAMYHNGPQYVFKTKGVKTAIDVLTRNHIDVFIFTGFLYDMTINIYILSDLNQASELMTTSQTSMVKQLLFTNVLQLMVFNCLKMVSLYVPPTKEE